MHQSYNYMQKTTGPMLRNFFHWKPENFGETWMISDIFKSLPMMMMMVVVRVIPLELATNLHKAAVDAGKTNIKLEVCETETGFNPSICK